MWFETYLNAMKRRTNIKAGSIFVRICDDAKQQAQMCLLLLETDGKNDLDCFERCA